VKQIYGGVFAVVLFSAGCVGSGRHAPPIESKRSALGAPTALGNATSVSAGAYHTCALLSTGGVACWGYDGDGELGNGSATLNSLVPVQVTGLTAGVQAIAAGGNHTCAIVNGGVQCWGFNALGQLGNGSTTTSLVPVQVTGLTSGVQAIAAGADHTCALVGGGVWCWGSNANGQVGEGTTVNRLVPVQVTGLASGAQAVAAGAVHSCAVVQNGAQCWGGNHVGQLGNGSMTQSLVPSQVSGLTSGVQAVAAGSLHTCALVNGGVQCWGYNERGQLGNGSTTTTSAVPTQVSGITTGAQLVAAGGDHACALISGAAQCWGYNASGELGNGTTIEELVPVPVSGLSSGVGVIAGGAAHTCAVVSGGVLCWGYNGDGELGDGTTTFSTVPVTVAAGALGGPGAACTAPNQCANGNCFDGVCCASASCGSCQACNVPGNEGTCTPVPAGSADPRGICVDDGATTCGTTGICDGAGGCETYASGTACYARQNFCDSLDAEEICVGGGSSCPQPPGWPANGCMSLSGGTGVQLDLLGGQSVLGGITLTFQGTISPPAGQSFGAHTPPSNQSCPTPSGFEVVTSSGTPQYWDIEASPPWTASPTQVCIHYDPTGMTLADECQLQLQHADNSTSCAWQLLSSNGSVCASNGKQCTLLGQPGAASCNAGQHAGTICAISDHMSPFVIVRPLPGTFPVIGGPGGLVVAATDSGGSVASYTVTVTDATDGTLVPTCTPASGSRFAPGSTTVSCTVTNSLQVSASASFDVQVHYQAPIDGTFFEQPINPDGSSLFKGGSTIPVKFQLEGASAGISNLVAHLLVARLSSGVTGTYLEATTNGNADSGNVFRSDGAGHYIYNLSTKGMASGTWSLRADLGDGVDHSVIVSLR
jgi:alpha-tubulin suppressor-like RCC1 family protein